jgi:mycothiol synthase
VLGVDPAEHGGGLGRSLSRIGLRHLAEQGLTSVLLYVDAHNSSAVAVYRRLGFETDAVSVMYAPA